MDFQKLFLHIPETIVVLSPDLKVLAATDEYLRITMRSRNELIGQDFLEAFPDNPDSNESKNTMLLRQSLERALNTKKVDYLDVLRYDIPKPASEGGGFDIRFWEASHTPVLDEEGNVEFIIQRTSDITDREIAKRALSESEQKFRFMAEIMPQLIFTTNAAGELTYFNQRWHTYTGIPVKELLINGWQNVIHPEDMEKSMSVWEEAFRNNTEMQLELRKLDKDGEYRWHLCRTLPMHDEQGNLLMWVGSSTDIHDTRQMVQELLESNEQMALLSDQVQLAYRKAEVERNTLLRLIDSAPAFFCILRGPEHHFELINRNYQRLFPNRQLLNKTVAEALPEVVEQGYIDLLDRVYQTGQEYQAHDVLIKLDQQDSGELNDVYVTFIYQPLLDEQERINGILVYGYDVTEQVNLKKQLSNLGNTQQVGQ
ncbi:PAS domain-containing protein [Pontibacter ruber]|uniref:histidine kinase n=1 Tax=Pontibacter ruber TaxID=1343895 RepID=A0ABW5D110_9BACT|nr:PAS domain-containing protein [Pontibacter ruber]